MTDGVDFGKNLAIAFVMFGLGAAGILIWQPQSPIFHTILDTSAYLTSALIAILLWDISKHTDQPLVRFLTIAFGVLAMAGLASQLKATMTVRRMNGTISEVLFAQDEAPRPLCKKPCSLWKTNI